MNLVIKKIITSCLLSVSLLLVSASVAWARSQCTDAIRSSFAMSGMPAQIYSNSQWSPLNVNFSGLTPGTSYSAYCYSRDCTIFCNDNLIDGTQYDFTADADGNGVWQIQNNNCWSGKDDFQVVVDFPGEGDCDAGDDIPVGDVNDSLRLQNTYVGTLGKEVYCFEPGDTVDWRVQVIYADGRPYSSSADDIMVVANGVVGGAIGMNRAAKVDANGYREGRDVVIDGDQADFGQQITYQVYRSNAGNHIGDFTGPVIQTECTEEEEAVPLPTGPGESQDYQICLSNLGGQAGALAACNACYSQKGIWTAVGCISQDPRSMISKIINIGIGILGGIFLLRVLAAGFTLTISQGDVKKTSEAKEMITESIIGVIFVIFSVTILQFIGAGVLKIPGFG